VGGVRIRTEGELERLIEKIKTFRRNLR